MVADVDAVTALVVTVNVALVAPAGTVTLAGTVAAELLLDSVTCAPPAGAGPARAPVPGGWPAAGPPPRSPRRDARGAGGGAASRGAGRGARRAAPLAEPGGGRA